MHDDITDIPNIRVGHDTNLEAGTGCTVIICDTPAVGGIDVRGGAPATRETDLLRPLNMVEGVHAILLTGGSAFGLDAASGVMRYLAERNIGFDVGVAKVPIVPAAAIFDLGFGSASVRPDADAGYRACEQARSEEHTSELQSRRDLVCRLLLEKKKDLLHRIEKALEVRRLQGEVQSLRIMILERYHYENILASSDKIQHILRQFFFLTIRQPPISTLFPYTTLFR